MKVFVCVFAMVLCQVASTAHAQDIEAKLSGATAGEGFTVLDNSSKNLFTVRGNGRVGINTATPTAGLQLISNDGFLASGTYNSGNIPTTGAGTRMMWYPRKAAFRVGRVSSTEWDDADIGNNSFASGIGTTASGHASVAFGSGTIASGDVSNALGTNTTASGPASTAIGFSTEASEHSSTALGFMTTASNHSAFASGHSTTASGHSSTAMGSSTTASGSHSFAIGRNTTASGLAGIAAGYYTTASGERSTAMGSYTNTNDKDGCAMIGDASTTTTMNSTKSNRFYARFDNGYVLYTKADRTTGMLAFNGASSWTSFSDSTRKEHYQPADAEHMLSSFSTLRLGSWNYRGDDQRHYGPMAQEWFAAFGRDGIGTIGNDTTLATADVDGVLCIAVQALEKRTADARTVLSAQEEQIKELRAQLKVKDDRITELHEKLERQQLTFNETLSDRDNAYNSRLDELELNLNKQDVIVRQLVRALHEQHNGIHKRFATQREETEQ